MLTPEDVAPTQTQQQVPVNPYQYPIAGAVTTQPAAALPYQQQPQQVYQQQQQPVQQQQAQDPYAAYQQHSQAAPTSVGRFVGWRHQGRTAARLAGTGDRRVTSPKIASPAFRFRASAAATKPKRR